jgi:hypothetical protein
MDWQVHRPQQNEYRFDLSEPSAFIFDNHVNRIRGRGNGFITSDCSAGDFIGYSNDAGALVLARYGSVMGGAAIGSARLKAAAFRNAQVQLTPELAYWIVVAAGDEYLKMVEVVVSVRENVAFVCANKVGHDKWNVMSAGTRTLTHDQVNTAWRNRQTDKVGTVATSDVGSGYGIAELAIKWW